MATRHKDPANKSDFTKNIAYAMFKTHVPKEYQKGFERFSPKSPTHVKPMHLKSFVVNDTNQPAVDALSHHLSIRETRKGGLGGVIIEGEPGVGKSQLVTQLLTEEHKMKEGQDFIRVPISLAYDKKQELLLKAFHEGQIVIIDEINASPMMERLLNALLEGHDLDNQAAKIPGFMIVGTQNPPSYCGRVQTTLPLKHRLQAVELSEYKKEEMQVILEKRGLSIEQAGKLIAHYQEHQQKSNLCFRDLLKAALRCLDNEFINAKEKLNALKFGNEDEQMALFIEMKHKAFQACKSFEEKIQMLDILKKDINSLENDPFIMFIKEKVRSQREKNGIGSEAKAERIEKAMAKISVEERTKLDRQDPQSEIMMALTMGRITRRDKPELALGLFNQLNKKKESKAAPPKNPIIKYRP